jgi:hypothetical protein|tara:strand:- start:44 stop:340 length:297 start_codon:yes stop_codon:yes gene_type:complete
MAVKVSNKICHPNGSDNLGSQNHKAGSGLSIKVNLDDDSGYRNYVIFDTYFQSVTISGTSFHAIIKQSVEDYPRFRKLLKNYIEQLDNPDFEDTHYRR